MAKKGSVKISEALEFTEEAVGAAKEALGSEWTVQLQERFSSYSPTGGLELSKGDMANLLKNSFTPSPAKIEMVMQFFAMTTGGDDGVINVENFINGMTLLYGDLSELALQSPLIKASEEDGSQSPLGVEQHASPSGEYAGRDGGIFGSPLAVGEERSRDPSPSSPLAPREGYCLEAFDDAEMDP